MSHTGGGGDGGVKFNLAIGLRRAFNRRPRTFTGTVTGRRTPPFRFKSARILTRLADFLGMAPALRRSSLSSTRVAAVLNHDVGRFYTGPWRSPETRAYLPLHLEFSQSLLEAGSRQAPLDALVIEPG